MSRPDFDAMRDACADMVLRAQDGEEITIVRDGVPLAVIVGINQWREMRRAVDAARDERDL